MATLLHTWKLSVEEDRMSGDQLAKKYGYKIPKGASFAYGTYLGRPISDKVRKKLWKER
jgi:hypothetical protein